MELNFNSLFVAILLQTETMKQLLNTIFFVILCVNHNKATNITNSTNASILTNSSSNATTPTQLTTLYIGAFFDLGTKDGYGSLPMAEQAIGEINNNTDMLPGYRLELAVNSTQVSQSKFSNIC